ERLCHQLAVARPGCRSRPGRHRKRRRAGHRPRRHPARPHGDARLEDLVDDVVADAEAGPGHDCAAETAAEERLQHAAAPAAHHSALLLVTLLVALLRLVTLLLVAGLGLLVALLLIPRLLIPR